MFSSKLKFNLPLRKGCIIKGFRFISTPQTVESSPETKPVSKSKEKKDPLMKNVLLGRIDDVFLRFSSHKNDILPDGLLQFSGLMKNNEQPLNHYEDLKNFAKNGFYKFSSVGSKESSVKFSELLQFYEELDLDPALSLLLEIHSSHIVPILENLGSTAQKDIYLNKVLTGEMTGAFCVTEETGSDPPTIKMLANEKHDKSFVLKGEKLWVTNAQNADFYILLVKSPIVNFKTTEGCILDDMNFIIADRSSGIEVEKQELLGLNECGIAKLKFLDHSVPCGSLIGPVGSGMNILAEFLKTPRFITLVCLLNTMKKMLADVTRHVNSRKQYPFDLRDNEKVQEKLNYVAGVTYTFESMLYMTSDLMDTYDIDISLESALLQIYGFEKVMNAIYICLDLFGSRALDKAYPYVKLLGDLKSLSFSITPAYFSRIFVGLTGLDYAGKKLYDATRKNRNPLNFPAHAFRNLLRTSRFESNKIDLNLALYKEFHPTLQEASNQLEYCVLRFQYIIEVFLSRHGKEAINRQIALNRIVDITLDIFSIIAILPRSSHSYCTGVQYCDEELYLARSLCYAAYKRAKSAMDDMMDIETKTNDSLSFDIAAKILNKKCYFIEHPRKHVI